MLGNGQRTCPATKRNLKLTIKQSSSLISDYRSGHLPLPEGNMLLAVLKNSLLKLCILQSHTLYKGCYINYSLYFTDHTTHLPYICTIQNKTQFAKTFGSNSILCLTAASKRARWNQPGWTGLTQTTRLSFPDKIQCSQNCFLHPRHVCIEP